MVMDLPTPSPKRKIDKWRFIRILRPHLGEEAAEQTTDALQDEFDQATTPQDMHQLYLMIRADMERMQAQMQVRMLGGMAIIAGIALAIARLT